MLLLLLVLNTIDSFRTLEQRLTITRLSNFATPSPVPRIPNLSKLVDKPAKEMLNAAATHKHDSKP